MLIFQRVHTFPKWMMSKINGKSDKLLVPQRATFFCIHCNGCMDFHLILLDLIGPRPEFHHMTTPLAQLSQLVLIFVQVTGNGSTGSCCATICMDDMNSQRSTVNFSLKKMGSGPRSHVHPYSFVQRSTKMPTPLCLFLPGENQLQMSNTATSEAQL